MYSLIIGRWNGTIDKQRVFEHTDDTTKAYLAPGGTVDINRLMALPTLVMPEIGDSESEQVARVGHLEHLSSTGLRYSYQFAQSPHVRPIPSVLIEKSATSLDITDWEFHRSHWAVKNVDLYRVLGDLISQTPRPTVFRLPVDKPQEDLVTVMMPFGAGFSPVYEALKGAATSVGLRCERADEIWQNHAIIDDIVSLIYRAQIVISDLTGRNPNVFYETGIAHALGREVIPIAQNASDVPFDLQHLRYVHYLQNTEGLAALASKLETRMRSLLTNSAG